MDSPTLANQWHVGFDYLENGRVYASKSLGLYGYVSENPMSRIDPSGQFDLNFGGGFHLPISPGVAVGPSFTSSVVGYSDNPFTAPLTSNPTTVDVAVGVIADIGVQAGLSDISGTGGKDAAPISINLGLGKYSGIQITPRISQDESKWVINPARYIDAISFGIGVGVASPVSASGTLETPHD